jgi:hypothetical protein
MNIKGLCSAATVSSFLGLALLLFVLCAEYTQLPSTIIMALNTCGFVLLLFSVLVWISIYYGPRRRIQALDEIRNKLVDEAVRCAESSQQIVRVAEYLIQHNLPELYFTAMEAIGPEALPKVDDRCPQKEFYWYLYDFCLSYAQEDVNIVRKIKSRLETHGDVRIFDYNDHNTKAKFATKTGEQVGKWIFRDASRFAIVVLSSHSHLSDICKLELNQIQERRSRAEQIPDYLTPIITEDRARLVYRDLLGPINFFSTEEIEDFTHWIKQFPQGLFYRG